MNGFLIFLITDFIMKILNHFKMKNRKSYLRISYFMFDLCCTEEQKKIFYKFQELKKITLNLKD